MAKRWWAIRVEMTDGPPWWEARKYPPGRIMVASPSHKLADLGIAIDLSFGRWDLAHLHSFDIGDSSYWLYGDPDYGKDIGDTSLISLRKAGLSMAPSLSTVFDFGDGWMHDCIVEGAYAIEEDEEEFQPQPHADMGWGTLPDQYGRFSERVNWLDIQSGPKF